MLIWFFGDIQLKLYLVCPCFILFLDLSYSLLTYLREIKNVFNSSNKDYLLLKYEDLTDNFNYQLKKVLSLLKIADVNLKFLKTQNYKKNIISKRDHYLHLNVKNEIMKNNSQKWKKNISKYQRVLIYLLCFFNIIYLDYKF